MSHTIGALRRDLVPALRPVANDLATREVDRLIGEVVGGSPTELTLRYNEELSEEQYDRLMAMVKRRCDGTPLAYVIGHVEFHGLDLLCDERVMIPRPESEEALEIAIENLPAAMAGVCPLAVDVGTGSGNLALALAHARPDLQVIAVDINDSALKVAKINRDRCNLNDRVHFVRGAALSMIAETGSVDLIISNPPYIAPGDPGLEQSVYDYEPHVALFSGKTGVENIRELIDQSLPILKVGGSFTCEIGYDQAPLVALLASPALGWDKPEFYRDLAGIERVFAVRRLS